MTKPRRRSAAATPAVTPVANPALAALTAYTQQAHQIILARQDPHTGLLPASTAITVHGDYTHAWVRDNVYSILAVWALALAWRRIDPPQAAPLERQVTALMRGLLAAMIKQAHKVERFKHSQHPLDALHAKYHTRSGEPVVGDADWGHLQIDATAIFVLLTAQMSAQGLVLVETDDELCFVQNLVYYLAKAWRTPDFGIWERGHKRNEGVAEVNASSVGMAKAALQAIAGARLRPAPSPAIHVMADDIAHARNTLDGLLPRESASKETDAALLAVIGYPAFAVEDAASAARTRADIVAKLQGRYGCKRFLRDGHQTAIEDHSRLHYEPGELAQFEHIEAEWPLFFTYLLIDAAMRGDAAEASEYRGRLDSLLQQRDGQALLPELYSVPADLVEAERASPHSQPRQPNDNVPLVWAQSLYLVGVLLQEGFIGPDDLDPLGRRPQASAAAQPLLQVALLAEDRLVQSRLAALGLRSETPAQVAQQAPVQVLYAQALEAALAELGRCEGLGLSGRPRDGVGSLATSQVYGHGSDTLVFLPSYFNRPGFYLTLDNRLLVEEILAEAAYIRRHWRGPGQPLLVIQVADTMLDARGADRLLGLLQALVRGEVEGMVVGALLALLPTTNRSVIDWPAALQVAAPAPAGTAELDSAPPWDDWDEAATRPLTAGRVAALAALLHVHGADDAALHTRLARCRNPYEQVEITALLWRQYGEQHQALPGVPLRRLAEAIYARAGTQQLWGVLRRAAGLLGLVDESLEDALVRIVAGRRRVSLAGPALAGPPTADSDRAGAVLDRPCSNTEIYARLLAHGGADEPARALIQEAVLLLGTLTKAEPALFKGMLTLRAWPLVQGVVNGLAREHGLSPADALDHVLGLSPQALLGRLRELIAHEQAMGEALRLQQHLHPGPAADLAAYPSTDSSVAAGLPLPPSLDAPLSEAEGGWPAWREISGVITRVPADFYSRVWVLLRHCPGLVIGDAQVPQNRLDSQVLQADTTAAEPAFALQVEDLLNQIPEPAYRQLSIEALLALHAYVSADISAEAGADGLRLEVDLVIDQLLASAVSLHWQHQQEAGALVAPSPVPPPPLPDSETAAAWLAFYAQPPHVVAARVVAALLSVLAPPQPEPALPAPSTDNPNED